MRKKNGIDEFQRMKLVRVNKLKEFLKEQKEVDLEYTKAKFSLETGIHKETISGYLDDLEIMGKIEIGPDLKIRWIGGEEKDD